jgi:hypothetical protein
MTIVYRLLMQKPRPEAPPPTSPPARPARIAWLTALARRFEGMVRSGVVQDYAELVRIGHITRAQVTQRAPIAIFEVWKSLKSLAPQSGRVSNFSLHFSRGFP